MAIGKLKGGSNPFRALAETANRRTSITRSTRRGFGAIGTSEWITESLQRTADASSAAANRPARACIRGATAAVRRIARYRHRIYNALIAIGVSGQGSIDKVAGPVGEALIMTASVWSWRFRGAGIQRPIASQ